MVAQLLLRPREKGAAGDAALPQAGIHTASAGNGSSVPMLAPKKSRSLLLSPQIEGKLQRAIGRNYKHPVLITDGVSSIPLKSKIPSHKCKVNSFCPIYYLGLIYVRLYLAVKTLA